MEIMNRLRHICNCYKRGTLLIGLQCCNLSSSWGIPCNKVVTRNMCVTQREQRRDWSESVASNCPLGKNVLGLLQRWEKTFEASGIPEPDLSALHIMGHILNIPHNQLQLHFANDLNENQQTNLDRLCHLRLQRMPVQYIIGEWEFRDLTLKMLPPVFIPRPETEELVEHVLTQIKDDCKHDASILEIGCGSGAISLSLLKALPEASCIAVDRSEAACSLTRENAATYFLQNRLQVIQGHLGACGITNFLVGKRFDVLVSNPPYIPFFEITTLQPEITLYEDSFALNGGEDGLEIIKKILDFAPSVLKDGGHVFLEVHYNHSEAIAQYMMSKKLCFEQTIKDFAGKDRFVILKYNER